MRGFLAGAVLGIALGVAGSMLLGESEPEHSTEPPTPNEEVPVAAEGQPPAQLDHVAGLEGRETPAGGDVSPGAPFAPGTAVLRVGDVFVFGERQATRLASEADEEKGDLVCQDIRYGASLRCPHGAVPVAAPFTLDEEPPTAEWVYKNVTDGPEDYPQRNASLPRKGGANVSGVVFVKARDETVYKVRLVEWHGDPRTWMRWVRIEYAEVSTKFPDGGQVRVPGQPEVKPLSGALSAAVKAVLEGPSVPSDSFRSFLRGSYRAVSGLPAEMEFNKRTYLALDEPLDTSITFKRYSGLVAGKGIAREGRVNIKSYSGVLIEGDLDGEVNVGSYGYIHVKGDVNGTINCNSYTTVIVEGDVNVEGKINVRSYVTLRVKGRFRNPSSLDCKGSCWSTFFFDAYHSGSDLEQLPATSQVTLHVRESDLPEGKQKLTPWREVIVGDKLWKKLN